MYTKNSQVGTTQTTKELDKEMENTGMKKEIYIVMEPDRGYGQYAVVAFFSKGSAEKYVEDHRGTWIDIVEIE